MRQEGKICAEKSMKRIRQKGKLLKKVYLLGGWGRVRSGGDGADWADRGG